MRLGYIYNIYSSKEMFKSNQVSKRYVFLLKTWYNEIVTRNEITSLQFCYIVFNRHENIMFKKLCTSFSWEVFVVSLHYCCNNEGQVLNVKVSVFMLSFDCLMVTLTQTTLLHYHVLSKIKVLAEIPNHKMSYSSAIHFFLSNVTMFYPMSQCFKQH